MTSVAPDPAGPAHDLIVRRVEAFYQHLLALEGLAHVEHHLDALLRLLAELTEAQLVYLELAGDGSDLPYWNGYAAGHSPTPVRARVSHTIVRNAIADCRPVECASAVRDPSLSELASVRHNQIGSVLCVPVGRWRAAGALYLQGTRAPSTVDRRRIELLARRIAPHAARLARGASAVQSTLADELRALQERRVLETLERCDGNVARAARELGVGRAFIYSIVRRTPAVYPEDPDNTP